jgi:hypothetical protein
LSVIRYWATTRPDGHYGLLGYIVLPGGTDVDVRAARKGKCLRLKIGLAAQGSLKLQRIAIAGATGYIGGRLAPQLLAAGYAARCLVRSPAKLDGRSWTADSRVEIRRTDLADAASLARDLEGCAAGFYLYIR